MSLNMTALVPVKWAPVIVMVSPGRPLVGVNAVIVGLIKTVNKLRVVAVPAGVVTVIRPLPAPEGTVAVISSSLWTAKPAEVPSKVTAVASARRAPLIAIVAPATACVGANDWRTGGPAMTANEPVLEPVPAGVVTATRPLAAAKGTMAVSNESFVTAKAAFAPANVTAVASLNADPRIVTLTPGTPDAGLKLDTVGAASTVGSTVNVVALRAVPAKVVTLTGPDVAAAGTVAMMRAADTTVKLEAAAPLNDTLLAPANDIPRIATGAPTCPREGLNPRITGGSGTTLKLESLVNERVDVVTDTGPDEASDASAAANPGESDETDGPGSADPDAEHTESPTQTSTAT